MQSDLEIEVKLASGDLDRIRAAGFELSLIEPRHFEDNWLLDWPDQRLRKMGAALRVRSANGRGLLTYKGVVRNPSSSVKIREEIECGMDHPAQMVELLERLGFQRSFRYQKYRTVYLLAFKGVQLEVAYDETPMGAFIEIEGDEGLVRQVIRAAGFSDDDAVRESYPELQASRCKARGAPVEDLVFGQ